MKTEKEKAAEYVLSFYEVDTKLGDSASFISLPTAKQCAKECVEAILDALRDMRELIESNFVAALDQIQYYKGVLEEIDNIDDDDF